LSTSVPETNFVFRRHPDSIAFPSILALYLITGAAGFIGSHLARALAGAGQEVRGVDNLSTGLRSNLDEFAGRIDFREIDIRDAQAVATACDGVDVILHQAALPSVPRSVLDPRTSHESNIDGTFNVLEGARAAGVRRVVYAASSSAYGDRPGFPRVETMAAQPISPYAVQKLTGELYMQSYWRVYGIETVCLRYFNIFGPRQAADSAYSGVMARFIAEMLDGRTPTIFGDGEQGRDFTYVDNAVQANLLAATAEAERCAGRVFNIACGERHTLNETYAALAELMDFPHAAQYGPARAGDVRDSLADITAARLQLGYSPDVTFHYGLARTIAWYRSNLQTRKL
jgi:nucleoside-diphosphate-sugar epimerase